MSDLEIEPFELDISDEVKHLYDEHARLAEVLRNEAFSFGEDAAQAQRDGDQDIYEHVRHEESVLHEKADLHEHTANVLAIILDLGEEAA